MFDQEDYLQHYGVLGMKWGKRKQDTKRQKIKTSNSSDKFSKKQKALIKKYGKLKIADMAVTGSKSLSIARDLGPIMGLRFAIADSITKKDRKKKNTMYKYGMYDL